VHADTTVGDGLFPLDPAEVPLGKRPWLDLDDQVFVEARMVARATHGIGFYVSFRVVWCGTSQRVSSCREQDVSKRPSRKPADSKQL
jgi:hypothetical protein